MLGLPWPCFLRSIKSEVSSSENNLHIFSWPKCSFSWTDFIVKYWYTLPWLSIQPFLTDNTFDQAKVRTAFSHRLKQICTSLQITLSALCRMQSFWHPMFWNICSLPHLRFCIDLVSKSVIFSFVSAFYWKLVSLY